MQKTGVYIGRAFLLYTGFFLNFLENSSGVARRRNDGDGPCCGRAKRGRENDGVTGARAATDGPNHSNSERAKLSTIS